MPASITMHGTVKPDGTLELDGKISLPPGRVQIVVEPVPLGASQKRGVLEVIAEIRKGQESRGHVPPTKEEIDAEINALCQDAEEEMQGNERRYEECRRSKEQGAN